MNERIARLRAKNLTQQPEICSERAQIVTRAYEKYKDLPPLLLRAKTFEAIMQEMTIWIADDELIEVTPKNIRLRKRILDNAQRMKLKMKNK